MGVDNAVGGCEQLPNGTIITYTRCWGCMFGDHFETPTWHGWADSDDIEHAEATGQDVQKIKDQRCACECARAERSNLMGISRERHYAIAEETLAGRVRAHAKHGANSIEAIDGRDPRWLSILVEEVGEASHEMTYDATGDLRAELVDVITVATAWVDALDRAWLAERSN